MSKKMSNILISVLFLLLGIVILLYRSGLESRIKMIVGIGVIVLGAIRIVTALIKNKEESQNASMVGDFIVGLILVAFGVFILVVHMALAVVIGAFFIMEGLRRLIYAISTFDKNVGWIISLIIALAILGAGVFFVIKRPDVTAVIIVVIAIVLIVMGIQGIIAALSGKKKGKKTA